MIVKDPEDVPGGREFAVQLGQDDVDIPTNAFIDFVGSLGKRNLVDGVKLGAFRSAVKRLYSSTEISADDQGTASS